MSSYGYDKPIIHTEGSLTCPKSSPGCDPPVDAFFETQADYVVWLYVRNWAAGGIGTIWYQLEGPGWRYGSMVDEENQPKPAMDSFRFMTSELKDAVFIQTLPEYSPLQVFEFQTTEKRIVVIWSPDGQPYSFPLPVNVTKVLDLYGGELPSDQGEISILRPVYVELTP
jgi:hypothetical protein